MKPYFIDHSATNFKAFLSDTKHIILLKTGKKLLLSSQLLLSGIFNTLFYINLGF